MLASSSSSRTGAWCLMMRVSCPAVSGQSRMQRLRIRGKDRIRKHPLRSSRFSIQRLVRDGHCLTIRDTEVSVAESLAAGLQFLHASTFSGRAGHRKIVKYESYPMDNSSNLGNFTSSSSSP